MTPDMKRLCEAAKDAHFNGAFQADIHGYIGYDDSAEAIVRAVLAALREPSREALDSAGYVSDTLLEDGSQFLPALIDRILSEPASA